MFSPSPEHVHRDPKGVSETARDLGLNRYPAPPRVLGENPPNLDANFLSCQGLGVGGFWAHRWDRNSEHSYLAATF